MNADLILIAAISATPPTLMALAALITSLRNGKKADANAVRIEQVHLATNGKMAELLQAVESNAYQKGRTDGRGASFSEAAARLDAGIAGEARGRLAQAQDSKRGDL